LPVAHFVRQGTWLKLITRTLSKDETTMKTTAVRGMLGVSFASLLGAGLMGTAAAQPAFQSLG